MCTFLDLSVVTFAKPHFFSKRLDALKSSTQLRVENFAAYKFKQCHSQINSKSLGTWLAFIVAYSNGKSLHCVCRVQGHIVQNVGIIL